MSAAEAEACSVESEGEHEAEGVDTDDGDGETQLSEANLETSQLVTDGHASRELLDTWVSLPLIDQRARVLSILPAGLYVALVVGRGLRRLHSTSRCYRVPGVDFVEVCFLRRGTSDGLL